MPEQLAQELPPLAERAARLTELPLAEVVEDPKVYPRGAVSDMHADDLAYAIDAGITFPPVVVDEATRKIVDGFHRVRAYRRRLGKDGSIICDVRAFTDDAEMLLESARLNARHGLPLGRHDQRVVTIRARELGVADETIATALGVTPQRLTTIAIRVAQSAEGNVPLKRGAEHLSGQYLRPEQIAAIRRMRGAPAAAKARELSELIRTGIAPVRNDADLRVALRELYLTIDDALVAAAGNAPQ